MPRKCFFLKNGWLSLSTCYCGLTSLLNMRGWFPSFHNGVKKLPIVTWRENGKCMALIIQFSISIEKIQQNSSYEENWYPGLQDWYPYFSQSMGGFLPSDSHPLWYLCLIKWERTARMSFPSIFHSIGKCS